MAIQILDSGLEIYFRIGNTIKEVAKEGIGVNEWSPDAGQGVWVVPERGTKEFSIAVADVNNPGGLTTSTELREYILGLAATSSGTDVNIVGPIGQKTKAESVSVTLASDQDPINVTSAKGTSSTNVTVAASATAVTLKALNINRVLVTIRNDSVATLTVRKGSGATANDAGELGPGDIGTIKDYTGIITGIWSSATGNARVEEVV